MASNVDAKNVLRSLNRLKNKRNKRESVIVGYTANYAMQVHENQKAQSNREARDGVGQWKFLEQPFRELRKQLLKIITVASKAGVSTKQALLLAGLRLQRESQKLVPVNTGNLKGSAFTRHEKK